MTVVTIMLSLLVSGTLSLDFKASDAAVTRVKSRRSTPAL